MKAHYNRGNEVFNPYKHNVLFVGHTCRLTVLIKFRLRTKRRIIRSSTVCVQNDGGHYQKYHPTTLKTESMRLGNSILLKWVNV